jgi:hypothetical protein
LTTQYSTPGSLTSEFPDNLCRTKSASHAAIGRSVNVEQAIRVVGPLLVQLMAGLSLERCLMQACERVKKRCTPCFVVDTCAGEAPCCLWQGTRGRVPSASRAFQYTSTAHVAIARRHHGCTLRTAEASRKVRASCAYESLTAPTLEMITELTNTCVANSWQMHAIQNTASLRLCILR